MQIVSSASGFQKSCEFDPTDTQMETACQILIIVSYHLPAKAISLCHRYIV